MKWLLPFNVAWIIWLTIRIGSGVSAYSGQHAHSYAWFFILGLAAWIVGTVVLKWVWFRGTVSRLAQLGFALWIVGFFSFCLSMLLGVNVPSIHILKQHVLFGHVNFMVFLFGLILSAYLDLVIVSNYAPFKPLQLWRDNNRGETD